MAEDGLKIRNKQWNEIRDLWSNYFGFTKYEDLAAAQQTSIDNFVSDYFYILNNMETVSRKLDSVLTSMNSQAGLQGDTVDGIGIQDFIGEDLKIVLGYLSNNADIATEIIRSTINGINDRGTKDRYDDSYVQNYNIILQEIITKYKQATALIEAKTNSLSEEYDHISQQLNGFFDAADNTLTGRDSGLKFYIEFLKKERDIRNTYLLRKEKFRKDTPPKGILPYQCRIGAATFYVPPTNISVSQVFKTVSLTGGAIRQPNTMKTNLGHSETVISMTLYFPNHQTIWGFNGDQAPFNIMNWDPEPVIRKGDPFFSTLGNQTVSDEVIDKYLSSLRGLVTQFKYAPFLPIKNAYLNQTYDINAVAMKSMTVSTLPNFPFVLVVQLEMYKFNYNAYLPMIDDFDQAIHWGKYRQYMGKAVARLDSMVNQGFLVNKTKVPASAGSIVDSQTLAQANETIAQYEGDITPKLSKVEDLRNGSKFDLYYPVTTPNKVFAPDVSGFTQYGEETVVTEEQWDFLIGSLGLSIIKKPDYNPNTYSKAYVPPSQEMKALMQWLDVNRQVLSVMDSNELDKFVNDYMNKLNLDKNSSTYQSIKTNLEAAWFFKVYDLLLTNNSFFRDRLRNFDILNKVIIKEWRVPMDKISIDWNHCIVTGINVSLSNTFASLQVQMQPEPTYQHLGGGDGTVNVSMMVIGEDNLIKLRRLFDHINGLARLEHNHGVLGFLGIKNVITALCGIKYVLPLSFETETVPNFPHVYSVNLSFIDFDILQQQREELSSVQQKKMLETFGTKRNPFLRLKQNWSAFSAYPDMPLDIRDEDGNIVTNFDPDWYFRAFKTSDSDLFDWKQDLKLTNFLKQYDQMQGELEAYEKVSVYETDEDFIRVTSKKADLKKQIDEIKTEIDRIVSDPSNSVSLPGGWVESEDGTLKYNEETALNDSEEPEITQVLGTFSDNPNMSVILSQYRGGYFRLGTQEIKKNSDGKNTTEKKYIDSGMSVFKEDLASKNLKDSKYMDFTSSISSYQQEYESGDDNPNRQFSRMMEDFNYRNLRGRMIKAFPTYMLWLIDEGGKFAGIKLFDNYYSLNSVIDFSVLQSEDCIGDTLVLRLSNVYSKLTTPYMDQIVSEVDPLYETGIGRLINIAENRARNLYQGLVENSDILNINSIRLKPGVRVHLRMGYSSNPNSLQTVFNGVITEVESGDVLTIVAQSDAVELTAMVNTANQKGHSGKLDGGINTGFWMSEPRDLMVRLLSMGSSNFKEYVAAGTKGMVFSESRFGIRHFGSILYEPLNTQEENDSIAITGSAYSTVLNSQRSAKTDVGAYSHDGKVNYFAPVAGKAASALSDLNFGSILGSAFNPNMYHLIAGFWANTFSKRDYELFKRNIYPGNGTGIAQFMGGDQIDAGVVISTATAFIAKSDNNVRGGYSGTSQTDKTPAELGRTQQLIEEITKNYQLSLNIPNLPSEYNNAAVNIEGGSASLDGTGLDAMSNEKILEILQNPDFSRQIIDVVNDSGSGGLWGIAEDILRFGGKVVGGVYKASMNVTEILDPFKSPYMTTLLKMIPGISDQAAENITKNGVFNYIPGVNGILAADGIVGAFANPISTIKRISSSPLARIIGLSSSMQDDDLDGYDEVSFRAQTYMKTVWDLFKVCAALLPNYIVAVRPFEDRSTVFYGKPHWLYTSGVVPVTAGLPADPSMRPKISANDPSINALFKIARQTQKNGEERIKELAEKSMLIDNREIMAYGNLSGKVDPYDVGGSSNDFISTKSERQKSLDLLIDEETKNTDLGKFLISTFESMEQNNPGLLDKVNANGYAQMIQRIVLVSKIKRRPGESSIDWTALRRAIEDTKGAIINDDLYAFLRTDIWGSIDNEIFKSVSKEDLKAYIIRSFEDYSERIKESTEDFQGDGNAGEKFWNMLLKTEDDDKTKENINFEDIRRKQLESLGDQAPIKELAVSDPITFAYRFGWKLSRVPVYIDPSSGYGVDKVGDLARRLWQEDFSSTTDAIHDTRDFAEGSDAWHDFRLEYPGRKEALDIFISLYSKGSIQPGASAEGSTSDIGNVSDGTDEASYVNLVRKFGFVMDLFMRYLWQDPFNRAWIIAVAKGKKRSTSDATGDSSRRWDWSAVDEAWKVFLSDKVRVTDRILDPLEPITAPNTRGFMEANITPGKDPRNWIAEGVSGVGKAIGDWWDNSVGKLLSVFSDTLSGLIASIRVSLGQLGTALSLTGDMQRQANILNSILMDSIYYKAGSENPSDPGYLLRLCDNPFTREYGEPVVEIREPFQRMHFISSFDSILYNQIKENFENVTTVVTAVSDGKYPVTVHFDKSIPPNRQVEKTVETGLLWDNAMGSGVTGIFQPLLHPLESFRSFAKATTGSSDQLSSRRVALYHLKESLKDIYGGEITVIGNPDIRPHDLVYIADVYEKMYGMVEVEQVIHHFTPETGFITAITPNALVSINDPVRWTMMSYMWNKMTSYNIRDDTRALLNIKADRITAMANAGILNEENIYQYFGSQIQGSIQWTQGNTAIIRDIGAMFTGGGVQALRDRDKQISDLWSADMGFQLTKWGLTGAGAAIGFVAGGPAGAGVGGGLGYGAGELLWSGWQYVKENLMDQHGCYIQYLNKQGLPMDAGLGHSQGVAVGTNHMVSLFPRIFGIPSPKSNVTKDGKFRITTNDILSSLGWVEYESISAFRDTSIFVNQINSQILKIANPNLDGGVDASNFIAIKARVLSLYGEDISSPGSSTSDTRTMRQGVTDADTIWAEVLESVGPFRKGQKIEVRFAGIDAYETAYKRDPQTLTGKPDSTVLDPELQFAPSNDLGRMGKEYLMAKFASEQNRFIAIRVAKKSNELFDKYGRVLGVIFANATTYESDGRLEQVYRFASKNPPIPLDSYMSDGRAYTLNWELVMMGLANVYMNDIIWDSQSKQGETGP